MDMTDGSGHPLIYPQSETTASFGLMRASCLQKGQRDVCDQNQVEFKMVNEISLTLLIQVMCVQRVHYTMVLPHTKLQEWQHPN